jgi:cellulose synthase/poly-beta-1,6-N-acetylglucosamine synthase-like glycosyltransferase
VIARKESGRIPIGAGKAMPSSTRDAGPTVYGINETVTETPTKGKVSIIIPCSNDGPMLREALASVEKVRNENVVEVIIVNDGSS